MELVVGPFHPELEDALVSALKRQDPRSLTAVVAPSQRLADRVKELALVARPRGIAGLHVYNLFSFARSIYDEAGGSFVDSDLLLEGVLARIVEERFREERYLPRALFSRRSIGALLSLLRELKDAAVDPDRALQAVAEGELGEEEAPKLSEIFSLYKHYSDELLRRGIHERPDVARIASEAARTSRRLERFRRVFYYGFYDLVQTQLDLVKAVSDRVDTTVFLPKLPGNDYARDLLPLLGGSPRPLADCSPNSVVTVLSASGAHDEVWAAAKQILAWADEGVPLRRIGIVARILDPYVDLLDSVLRENRIPFSSTATRTCERDPLWKAARSLLTMREFPRDEVLDLLSSPYFVREEGAEPELWDAASRRLGIGRGATEWRRRLGSKVGADYVYSEGDRGEEKKFVLPRDQVRSFWDSVTRLLDAPAAPGDWAGFSAWAVARVRNFLRPLDRAEPFGELLEILESLATLPGPVDEEILRRALASMIVPVGDPRGTGIQVLDAMQARGLSFDRLVVLGLNERVFPRYILEDPFLRDAVRSRLDFRLGNRITRKLDGYGEERLLFDLLLRAAPRVLLTYQRTDEKGRLQVPSVFLRGWPAAVAVPRSPTQRFDQIDWIRLTPREAALLTGEAERAARSFGRDPSLLIRADGYLRETSLRDRLTAYDGVIDARDYWNRVAEFGLSPTSLERMATCPFSYFASQILDLEELEEPEAEEMLSPLEIGSVYHGVLERYVKDGERDLPAAVEAGLARLDQERSFRYPILAEAERRRIRRVLAAFVEAERESRGSLRPAGTEVALKRSLSLEVGGRSSVTFRGFLDRVDLSPTAFRVIDYKRRKSAKYPWKTMEKGVLEYGRYWQPPLYYLLAEAEYRRPEGSFAYYFIEDAPSGSWRIELDAQFWRRRGRVEALLRNLLEGIAAGRFFVRPGEHCAHCEFRTMCRKTHLLNRLRAAVDPAARRWLEFPRKTYESEKPLRSKRTR